MKRWRLLDTGARSAADNMALDEVILEQNSRGASPNTIRFLQFSRPAVLLGYHQCAAQEIRRDYCRANNIEINRRITGGGAIFFDRSQIGWEIFCRKDFFNVSIANPRFFEDLCAPVIRALSRLGVDARFRPRNDIEVDGRKISGTGGTEQDDSFLFQGTLLVDFDVETMIRALRIPIEKLGARELASARDRVTCLGRELGELPTPARIKRLLAESFETVFGIRLANGGLTGAERTALVDRRKKFTSQEWIEKVTVPAGDQPVIRAGYRARGGLIRVAMIVNRRLRLIRSLMLTGDFFSYPRRAVFDLEALFKDFPAERGAVERQVKSYFKVARPRMPGVRPRDFCRVIFQALDRLQLGAQGISIKWSNDVFAVNGTFEDVRRRSPGVLLLPYCAKSRACGFRHRRGCAGCGKCSAGAAFELAREHRLEATTVLNFEDLLKILRRLKARGGGAYVGCCCEAFYLKHQPAFENSGVPGILLNINNSTCYDLDRAVDAYQGRFESQTEINVPLLSEVLNAM